MTSVFIHSVNDPIIPAFNYNTLATENILKSNSKLVNNLYDKMTGENFCKLITRHFEKDLDYILAVVRDEAGNYIPYDGCRFASIREFFRGRFDPTTLLPVAEVLYYSLQNFEEATFKLLGSENNIFFNEPLTSQKCYIFANDYEDFPKERAKWSYLYGNSLYETGLHQEAIICFNRAAQFWREELPSEYQNLETAELLFQIHHFISEQAGSNDQIKEKLTATNLPHS